MRRIFAALLALALSAMLLLAPAPANAGEAWDCDGRHRTSKWSEFPNANLKARVRVNYTFCSRNNGFEWYYSVKRVKFAIDRSGWRTYGCTDADRYRINVSPVGGVNMGPESWRCRDNDPHYRRDVPVFRSISPGEYANDRCFDFKFTEVLWNQPDRVHKGSRKCI